MKPRGWRIWFAALALLARGSSARAAGHVCGATIPTPAGPVTVGFYRPGEPKTACDGYVGHMTCRGGDNRLRCE